ncbi:MAG: hypothetical protein PWP27_936, partial [Clostridiales bacterium]|nr:hypothetical protein [Clostridiales bacterium]
NNIVIRQNKLKGNGFMPFCALSKAKGMVINMKKKLFMLMVTLGASVLTFVAFMVSASACTFGSYQPEEPKCLRNE